APVVHGSPVVPSTSTRCPRPIGTVLRANIPSEPCIAASAYGVQMPSSIATMPSSTGSLYTTTPPTSVAVTSSIVSSTRMATATLLPSGIFIRTVAPSTPAQTTYVVASSTATTSTPGTSYSDDKSALTSTVYATSLQMAASSLHSPVSALRPSVKPLSGTTKATPIASYSSGRSTAPSIHITSIELLPSLTMTPPESPQIKSIGSDSVTSQLAVSRCTQPSTSGILLKNSSVVPTKSKSATITENLPTAAIVSSETSQNLDSSISSVESM
ncbi:AGAP012455-PA, partial [Anopheles gambiae str. PEST]